MKSYIPIECRKGHEDTTAEAFEGLDHMFFDEVINDVQALRF